MGLCLLGPMLDAAGKEKDRTERKVVTETRTPVDPAVLALFFPRVVQLPMLATDVIDKTAVRTRQLAFLRTLEEVSSGGAFEGSASIRELYGRKWDYKHVTYQWLLKRYRNGRANLDRQIAELEEAIQLGEWAVEARRNDPRPSLPLVQDPEAGSVFAAPGEVESYLNGSPKKVPVPKPVTKDGRKRVRRLIKLGKAKLPLLQKMRARLDLGLLETLELARESLPAEEGRHLPGLLVTTSGNQMQIVEPGSRQARVYAYDRLPGREGKPTETPIPSPSDLLPLPKPRGFVPPTPTDEDPDWGVGRAKGALEHALSRLPDTRKVFAFDTHSPPPLEPWEPILEEMRTPTGRAALRSVARRAGRIMHPELGHLYYRILEHAVAYDLTAGETRAALEEATRGFLETHPRQAERPLRDVINDAIQSVSRMHPVVMRYGNAYEGLFDFQLSAYGVNAETFRSPGAPALDPVTAEDLSRRVLGVERALNQIRARDFNGDRERTATRDRNRDQIRRATASLTTRVKGTRRVLLRWSRPTAATGECYFPPPPESPPIEP